jgi:hypothetical protein
MLADQTAAYWLQKSEKARARADEVHDDTTRATLLDVAAKYDAMAQQAEGREVRAWTRVDKRRPLKEEPTPARPAAGRTVRTGAA